MMVHNTRDYWGFWHCPLFTVLNNVTFQKLNLFSSMGKRIEGTQHHSLEQWDMTEYVSYENADRYSFWNTVFFEIQDDVRSPETQQSQNFVQLTSPSLSILPPHTTVKLALINHMFGLWKNEVTITEFWMNF
jgi:hypothetical protein